MNGYRNMDVEYQPVYRICPAIYVSPRTGSSNPPDAEETWPERRDRWIEHYERGDGYRQAVREAWAIVLRWKFQRWAFQEAGQNVGWSIGRLLAAFEAESYEIPEKLRSWADKHIKRYKRRKKRD